ncbi:MAG: phage integrase family protein, partial [Variovorax sp.]
MKVTTAPLFHAASPLRAGRPKGARSAVLASARALGIHHFAFLRATFVGIDTRAAFDRYLAWAETTSDLRHIEHRRVELLKQVLAAGRAVDQSRPPEQRINRLVELLATDTSGGRAAELPTLAQWMLDEGMDADAWSELDALAEYHAVHGLENPEALAAAAGLADLARERVAALNHLQTLLTVSPAPADALEAWFARSVATVLRQAGMRTLENLVDFINVHGHRWHSRVKGFGARRAQRVVAWLRTQQEILQLEVRASVDLPQSAVALHRGIEPGRLLLA